MAKGRESGAASALFNMMRNIGGSIGIVGLSHAFDKQNGPSERIGESVTQIRGADLPNVIERRLYQGIADTIV